MDKPRNSSPRAPKAGADLGGDHGSEIASSHKHAVIAGTGRAGTSFLVQLLDRCGLETDLATSAWHSTARAGFEHPLHAANLPYVVKDPALFKYCSSLDLSQIAIDALIVPIRDLDLAARSRVHQERIALLANRHTGALETQLAGITPGGILYSLDVVDQSRILAVGFHKLMHWAATHELPLYLLEFPRLVSDCDYTLHKLWPWLGEHCTEAEARSAFATTADVGAVRIRRSRPSDGPIELGAGEPAVAELDRAALLELLEQKVDELTEAREEVANAKVRYQESNAKLANLHTDLTAAQANLAETQSGLAEARSTLEAEQRRNGELLAQLETRRHDDESTKADLTQLERLLTQITASRSWRMTRPLRAAARAKER